MIRKFILAAAIVAILGSNAGIAWGQRSSTLDHGIVFDDVNDAYIDTIQAPSAEQCRAACLGMAQCQAWAWSGSKWGNGCARYKTNQLKREADPDFSSGVVSAAGATRVAQAFPFPQAPMTLIFRVPPPDDPNANRYASFTFGLTEGDGTMVFRRAWEGPLSQADTPTGGDQYVKYFFDEVPGAVGDIDCSISATPPQLRNISIGARLRYTRNCTAHFGNGTTIESTDEIERVVLRREKMIVPIGTFDAFVVRKITRSTSRIFRPAIGGGEDMEIAESESTRWWVPTLGFYVREDSRSRIVDRTFSPSTIEAHRRDGVPLLPKSTPWSETRTMTAIIKR